MKPDHSEFTGVQPIFEHPHVTSALAMQVDLLRPTPETLDLTQLVAEDVVRVEAARGVLRFMLLEPMPPMQTGSPVRVLEQTTLPDIPLHMTIGLNGATLGGSMIRPASVIPGSQLEVSVPRIQPVDIAQLAQDTGFDHEQIVDLASQNGTFFMENGQLFSRRRRRYLTGIVFRSVVE